MPARPNSRMAHVCAIPVLKPPRGSIVARGNSLVAHSRPLPVLKTAPCGSLVVSASKTHRVRTQKLSRSSCVLSRGHGWGSGQLTCPFYRFSFLPGNLACVVPPQTTLQSPFTLSALARPPPGAAALLRTATPRRTTRTAGATALRAERVSNDDDETK